MARPERFELPTAWFEARTYIEVLPGLYGGILLQIQMISTFMGCISLYMIIKGFFLVKVMIRVPCG